ncbi:MAG: DinB family protein [Tepidisphaeraceae bacterium]|jgi:hypothetical protein
MDKNVVLDLQAFQRGYIHLLTEDIPEEKMAAQPSGVPNHPAWHLGHLACAMDRFVQILGGASKIDPAWAQPYSRESTPSPNRQLYATKAELLALLDERRGEFARLFKNATPDDLAKPPPDPKVAQRFPTIGMLVLFGATTHEATHLGQLAVWRRAMGMPQALSKPSR